MGVRQSSRIALRMRDCALALAHAPKAGWLNRKQLQKFIYLMDSVGYLLDHLPPRRAHETYRFGPYDAMIQRAVDTLVFRGIVQLVGGAEHEADRSVRYSLTPAGRNWVARLIEDETSMPRWEASEAVALHVGEIGWDALVELVYAEPTYAALRAEGYGRPLHVGDPAQASTAAVLSIFESSLHIVGLAPKRGQLIDLFFTFLDTYRKDPAASPEVVA